MILTEQDLSNIIKSTVTMVMESLTVGSVYSPYRIGVAFKEHALVRSNERWITERDVIDLLSGVSVKIAADFSKGILSGGEVFKVVDRDSCLVAVCFPEANRYDSRKIHRIVAITVYFWDGKMNYANSRDEKIYYLNEPGDAFIEAAEWNQEHQDLVGEYTRWKHGIDVKKQDERADYLDDLLNNPFRTDDVPSEQRLGRVRAAMKQHHKEDMENIYSQMSPEDFDAIRDYDMKMDYMPMSSKGSANRDLRAMDLVRQRKDAERQRKFYGDRVKDMSDADVVKLPKAVGNITLSDEDLKKDRINVKRKTSDETKNYRRKDKGHSR